MDSNNISFHRKDSWYTIENINHGGKVKSTLKFGYYFNEPIEKFINIISKYRHIEFGNNFSQSIDSLPDSIHTIKFSGMFNTIINKYPKNLRKIKFGPGFNQPIDNLPNGLQILIINQCIDEGKFNQSLDRLPATLKKIKINCDSYNKPVDCLPINLIELDIRSINFNKKINNLPETLKYLSISGNFNQPIDNLPDSLKHLDLECNIKWPLDNLPRNLFSLKIGLCTNFNMPLNNLPDNLVYLQVGYAYDHSFNNLKEGLEYLVIGDIYGTNLTDFKFNVPSTLKKLYISKSLEFIESIKHLYPEKLYFSNNINNAGVYDSNSEIDYDIDTSENEYNMENMNVNNLTIEPIYKRKKTS
jgi:hypothetical protein